jgi:hypothetical protein
MKMITELNKGLGPEWAGRAIEKKIALNCILLTSEVYT